EDVEHDAHAFLSGALVAGAARRREQEAARLAQALEALPSGRLLARRDEQDDRQRLLPVLARRDVQFIRLLRRVVIAEPLGRWFRQAVRRHGERPVEARRRANRHAGLMALDRRRRGRRQRKEREAGDQPLTVSHVTPFGWRDAPAHWHSTLWRGPL